MQIKATVRYHQTSVRMVIIKKTQIDVGEDVEKRESSYTSGGHINWCSHCRNDIEVSRKTKNRTTNDPAIPLLGIPLKKIKTLI